jgi:hypothetical protein
VDTPEITPEPPPFRRPADYYSSPVDGVRPLFPRWVPFGCGTAAIVLLVILGGVSAMVSTGAFGGAFEWLIASMEGEIDKMMTPDVKAPQKAAFEAEMKSVRDGIRDHRVTVDRLQPFMRTMRDAVMDERVTPAELDEITKAAHRINTPPLK